MAVRKFTFAALLVLGVSTSATAQFQVFDPQINRQAAECASTGNCHLNNMELNNHKANDYNSLMDQYEREDALRAEQKKQDMAERVAEQKQWNAAHSVKRGAKMPVAHPPAKGTKQHPAKKNAPEAAKPLASNLVNSSGQF